MPITCNIRFDKSSNIYYAGEEVSGTAFINNPNQKIIRGIEVKILGYCRAWIYKNEQKTTICYKSVENYIDSGSYVLGDSSDTTLSLEPATYEYPFKSEIPLNAPSSFEGKHGIIEYVVYVRIDRAGLFKKDKIFKEPFIVILALDLNFNPELRDPCSVEGSKHFAFLWSNTESFMAHLSVPSVGYVPGQTVHYKVDIKNDANLDLKRISVDLVQKVNYKFITPKEAKIETNFKLMEKKIDMIRRYCRKEICDCFVMPAVPPSTLDTTRYIQIQYFLNLKILGGYLFNDYMRSIRLMVGAIPLYNSSGQNVQENSTSDYNTPIKPPVFEDCAKAKNKAVGDDPFCNHIKTKEYAIKYPVYGHFNSQTMPDW